MSYGYVPAPVPASYIPPQPSWFSRNWKWFVPILVAGALLMVAAFVGGVLLLVFGSMKSSIPYQYAVHRVEENADAKAELGVPIHPGWSTSGSINVTVGGSGNADLEIPLQGSIRKGTLHVVAKKVEGQWTYQTLDLTAEGETATLNLIPSSGDNKQEK